MSKTPKRPRDPSQLAKFIIDSVTGDKPADVVSAKTVRAKKAGTKGGPARAKSLTPEQRSQIAHFAAQARWKKS